MLLVAAFVAVRLDAFTLWATVDSATGGTVRLPNTFASVDHPFHATRAFTLLQTLREGELLRWVGNHQGGYPVEFYPLGEAWLEVAVWVLTFGLLPILGIHKLVVVAIFLLPGLAFWLLARRDRLSAAVPLGALLVHVAVPGGWVHGGSKELVVWGLVTNVAAATALLFVLWALAAFLDDGNTALGAIAVLTASLALATNTRSAIALVIVGVGCWLAAFERSPRGWPVISARLALVGLATGALSAPIILPLIRFSDLYYFVRYSGYESIDFYIGKILTSVSPPVALLGFVGVGLGLLLPGRPASRAAAISLSIYVIVTATLATDLRDAGIFEQLEATRLMPFQRLVTVYLAVAGADALLAWIVARRSLAKDLFLLAAASLLFVVYVRPFDPVSADNHGLMREGETAQVGSPTLLSTANSSQVEFLAAVELADSEVPGDGAMLVLGSALGWHQQLWAPTVTDRPLFYNDFLWYWHRLHYGPYNYQQGNAYPSATIGQTLETGYLDEHGIAVVVVTSDAFKGAAASAPTLELIGHGLFDTYRVRNPAPMVRFSGGTTTQFAVGNGVITAEGTSSGGTARIARNWFPRWRAEVNGEPVPIARRSDGYMSIPVPAGAVSVELRYAVDRWDWFGRGLMMLGALVVMVMVGLRLRHIPTGSGRLLSRRSETSHAR